MYVLLSNRNLTTYDRAVQQERSISKSLTLIGRGVISTLSKQIALIVSFSLATLQSHGMVGDDIASWHTLMYLRSLVAGHIHIMKLSHGNMTQHPRRFQLHNNRKQYLKIISLSKSTLNTSKNLRGFCVIFPVNASWAVLNWLDENFRIHQFHSRNFFQSKGTRHKTHVWWVWYNYSSKTHVNTTQHYKTLQNLIIECVW